MQILGAVIFSFSSYHPYGYQEYNPIEIFLSLILFLPSLSVSVRRLHDTNKSGWWLLFPYAIGAIFGALAYILSKIGLDNSSIFVVIISIGIMNLYLLYLMLKVSDDGENQYGHNSCLIPK